MNPSRSSMDTDQQPLLHADAAELDTRFAIDDNLAEEQPALDPASPKYPPLPPSYDDTIRVDARSRTRWNPAAWFTLSRTTKEHIQACLPRTSSGDLLTFSSAFSGCYSVAMRCWPSNRFAQASAFIIGLWILVLFTGPSLSQSPDNIGSGLHQDWDYSNIPNVKPAPLHEDGHIVEEAKWQWHNCASIKGTSRVQCTETASFLLNPNKAKDSFASTESIFVDVDSLRPDRPQPAGSVPGTITVVHESFDAPSDQKDLVKVEITARYDEDYKKLFDTSLVAKMKRGLYDEGLEILTYAKAVAIQQSPLIFDVKVIVPPHVNVPTLSIDAGASNIDLFQSAPAHRRSFGSHSLHGRDPAPSRPDFYFGKLHARTQVGKLQSSSIRAIADIHLTTTNGKLHLGGSFEAQSLEFKTVNGHLDIDENSKLEAAYDLTLQTQNGHIRVGQHTSFRATTLRSESLNGGIIAEGAVFNVNHTLSLRSSTGRIEAAISVEKPDLARLDAPGLGKTDLVTVDAQSQTGSIELDFVQHEREVPLRCRASSEVATVSVALHPEFQGKWELRGATHSRYRGSGTEDGTETDRGVHRFAIDEDSFGWINRLTRGRTWWERPNMPSVMPKGAEATIGTQVGLAILTFK
ncbi:hypothetical protein PaG_05452 [Moesziomyces aphidis]|uniref:Adhesin domain-containing protein n=1 Tax=Moesziomyces aphidis TaxID=84754 RepID=W3VGE1_MOEAP|nr:hypothetical protein PaG_05452 [Moesziomyces aphidis]